MALEFLKPLSQIPDRRSVSSRTRRAHDVVMWDNRSVLHCATPYDTAGFERTMHRTTIRGTRPF